MEIRFHPHALERMSERCITQDEVMQTIRSGETFPAKFGRTGFRRNFRFESQWKGKHYSTKQVEAYAVREKGEWLVITTISKFF